MFFLSDFRADMIEKYTAKEKGRKRRAIKHQEAKKEFKLSGEAPYYYSYLKKDSIDREMFWEGMRNRFILFIFKSLYVIIALIILFIIITIINLPMNFYEYTAEPDTVYTEEYGTSNSYHRFHYVVEKDTWFQPTVETNGKIATRPDGFITKTDAPNDILYYNAHPEASGVRTPIYLPAGEYDFVVGANCMYDYSPKGFQAGLNTIDIKESHEKENNNSFKKANTYTTGTAKTGNLSSQDDIDCYKIKNKEQKHFYLSFSSTPKIGALTGNRGYFNPEKKRTLNNSEFYKIEIYENDELKYEFTSYGADIYQIDLNAGTTYYVKISSSQAYNDGAYSFIMSEQDYRDIFR